MEPRKLRLYDLKPQDGLTVQCSCGHTSRFTSGELQRKHRLPSDLLIYDLQYRLRCRVCRRWRGFRILLWDGQPMPFRNPHDVGRHRVIRHRVIVEGDINPRRI